MPLPDRLEWIRTRRFGVSPWHVSPYDEFNEADEHGVIKIVDVHERLVCHAWDENGDFIVHAPEDIDYLLWLVDKLMKRLAVEDERRLIKTFESEVARSRDD